MAAHLVDLDASLDTAAAECVFTRAHLQAYAYASALAADFDAIIAECKVASGEELDLRVARTSANALASVLDDDLNDLSDATAKTLLILTKRKTDDPLFTQFFGTQRPSEFKRPILGEQLLRM